MTLETEMGRRGRTALIAIGMVMAGTGFAWADAIDGTWCSERDHRQMTISGANAILPGGRRLTGDYTRHRFSYLVPLPDAEAGRVKVFRLTGDVSMMAMSAKPDGSEPSEPENWRRCELTS